MPYYTTDSEGNITAMADTPEPLINPKYTDEDIALGHDGKLYFESQVPPAPPPPLEEQQAAVTAAIQARLDDFARTRGYDNALACATYAFSPTAQFEAEGLYMLSARDETWIRAFEILEAVGVGAIPMPTVEDFLAKLPALIWPDEDEGVPGEPGSAA